MNDIFTLPDGSQVGTGLLTPEPGFVSALPVYADVGPMFTRQQIIDIAKSGAMRGRDKFDSSFIKDQKSHGCHDDKTEVLTETGWVPWTAYNWSDSLGTMNTVTHALEFQAPITKHIYDYDGPMYHVDHRAMDFALTPNHRMYARRWSERQRTLTNEYGFQEIGKLGWYVGLPHSTSGFVGLDLKKLSIEGGREFTGDDFLSLIALVISDGWVGGTENTKNRVSFCCFRDDRYPMVSEFAARLGIPEQPSRKGVWGFGDSSLAEWIRKNCFISSDYHSPFKRVPDIVKSVSQRQVDLFLKFIGDQDADNRTGGRRFYTASKRMADDIQELMLRIGKRASIHERDPRSTVMKDGRHIHAENCVADITINEYVSDNLSIGRKKDLGTDHYKGQVFCATVPNGTLITRRNRKILISGNSCNGFAGAAALTRTRIRRGLPRVDLSGAYLYSLINDGRDQGSLLDRGMNALMLRGCATADTVKWDQIFRNQYDKAKADAEAARFKASNGECYVILSEDMLFSALAAEFDLVVAVHADNGFMKLDNRGVAGGGQGPGNHAVGADGLYWDGELIADGVNSWGLQYGAAGRMGLTWARHFKPTVGNHSFYAVRAATQDPQDPLPVIGG